MHVFNCNGRGKEEKRVSWDAVMQNSKRKLKICQKLRAKYDTYKTNFSLK